MALVIAIFLWSLGGHSASFVVSEIFSNSAGRGSDRGKEWFELANNGRTAIDINKIRVDIFTDNKQTFSQELTLASPLKFENFLVIAQDANLGLDRCFRYLPVVTTPTFSLANGKDLTICVALNDNEQRCTKLSKKWPRPDGVALFRDPADPHEAPFFDVEPCLLADGIFATPGQPARSCAFNSNFAEKIFEPCVGGAQSRATISHFLATAQEFDDNIIDVNSDSRGIRFDFAKSLDNDPVMATLCKAPFLSPTICVVLERHALHSTNTSFVNWRTSANSESSHLVLRSFRGATKTITRSSDGFHEDVATNQWRPNIAVSSESDTTTIRFALTAKDLPLNAWLVGENGEILNQMGIVEATRSVAFATNKASPKFLRYAGMRGHGEMVLPVNEHSREENG